MSLVHVEMANIETWSYCKQGRMGEYVQSSGVVKKRSAVKGMWLVDSVVRLTLGVKLNGKDWNLEDTTKGSLED